MKYNKGKLKKEHSILPEFSGILQEIETLPAVIRIIPGRISRSQKWSSHFLLSVSYPTESGVKCIMKKGGTAQELFLTGDSEAILSWLKSLFTDDILKWV